MARNRSGAPFSAGAGPAKGPLPSSPDLDSITKMAGVTTGATPVPKNAKTPSKQPAAKSAAKLGAKPNNPMFHTMLKQPSGGM